MAFIPSLTGGPLQSDPNLAFVSDEISHLIQLVRQFPSGAYSSVSSTSYRTLFPAKVKKCMRAETQIGKIEVMKAVRGEEWNADANPAGVGVK